MRRLLSSLTPGVRVLLFVLVAFYAAGLVGTFTHTYNLSFWLALTGPDFWHGKVWKLVSYPLVSASIMDLLFNAVLLFFLGSQLERDWSKTQFWAYCVIVALGAGLVKVLIQPSAPLPMQGMAPVGMGLMVAYASLNRSQQIQILPGLEMTAWQAMLIFAAISIVMTIAMSGILEAVTACSGMLFGWAYLSIRWKINRSRPAETATSERIGRLEL